jgi:hypothetical protein
MTFATINHARVSKDVGVIRQCAFGDSQLAAGASKVAETRVVIKGQSEVGFAASG